MSSRLVSLYTADWSVADVTEYVDITEFVAIKCEVFGTGCCCDSVGLNVCDIMHMKYDGKWSLLYVLEQTEFY